jgi:ChaB
MAESRLYCRDRQDLPATLQRSGQEAQDTFSEAHDRAVQAYGERDQAFRAVYTALKEKYERRGDHWIAKRDSQTDHAAGSTSRERVAVAAALTAS